MHRRIGGFFFSFKIVTEMFVLTGDLQIIEVKTKKELKAFVRFPRSLYRDCPYYVPPLDRAEIKELTQHPALDFCTIKLWMAMSNGEIVGRIAGIINHRCNELKNQKRIRFGWFDVVDNQEIAIKLLETVEQWGRENGLDTMCGPSRFSNMQRQAMLVEGFHNIGSIEADYNFDYYPRFVESFGFEKEVDYIQYKVKVNAVPEAIERLAERLSQKSKIHLRQYSSKLQLKQVGVEFFKVLNQSYHNIFNFIPLTDKEIDWVVKGNFGVAVLKLVNVLEDENGQMVGISFCLPSLSRAFQKANGKLFPLGIFYILHDLKKNKAVDMYLTGVLPEYANSGVHLFYHKRLNEVFIESGYEYAFTSQQLEQNPAHHIWTKYYESELFCRRRCYKKSILPES